MKKFFTCTIAALLIFSQTAFAAFTEPVPEGDSVTGETVDGEQNVYGITYDAEIILSGSQIIKDGGQSYGTKVVDGWQTVEAGGIAYGTVVGSSTYSGSQTVVSGHVYDTLVINGSQELYSGAEAYNTIIGTEDGNGYGNMHLGSGSKAYNTIVHNGAGMHIYGGESHGAYVRGTIYITMGNTYDTIVEGDESLPGTTYFYISTGGNAYNTQISNARLEIYSGGTSHNTVIGYMGYERIGYGSRSYNAVVNNGGIQATMDARIIGAVVNEGGEQYAMYQGVIEDAIINFGGIQKIGFDRYDFQSPESPSSGGKGIRTIINGDLQVINESTYDPYNPSFADGSIFENGGIQEAYGLSKNNTVNNGTIKIFDTGMLSGTNQINKHGIVSIQENIATAQSKTSVINLNRGFLTALDQNTNGTFAIKVRGSGIIQANLDDTTSSMLNFTDITGSHSIYAVPVNSFANYADSYAVAYDSSPLQTASFSALDGGINLDIYEYVAKQNGRDVSIEKNGKYASYIRTLPITSEIVNSAVLSLSNSMHKRMGEIQWQKDNESAPEANQKYSAWARAISKSMTIKKDIEADQTLNGIEGGIDYQFNNLIENGALFAGLMGQISQSNPTFEASTGANSKSDLDIYSLGAYGTFIGKGGWYGDLVVRQFLTKHAVDTKDGIGNSHAKYTLDQNATAASVEGGRQIVLKDKFFITPKAQLSYIMTGSADSNSQAGKVKVGASNTYSLSAGAIAGYRFDITGIGFEPYIKASYVYISDGKTETEISGIKQDSDISGSRADLGLGIAAKINKNISVFADGTYLTGSDYSEYAGTAGLRFSFGGTYK